MKIELAPVAVEKDPVGSRSSGRDESARNTQGEAFDKAVRGAAARPAKAEGQGAGPRAATDATSKDAAPADDAAADETANAGETDPVADGTATPQPDAAAADIRALQSLLGLIGLSATLTPKAPADEATAPEQPLEKLPATPDADAAVSVPTDAAAEKVKALRLDVLRIETHFEPHQDGMVLVTTAGKADATGLGAEPVPAGLAAAVAAAASAPGHELAALLSGPARSSGREAAAAKDAASSAAATESRAEVPRLSFDEALAQLGQGAGERSGSGGSGGSGRDGSTAAQAALADLDLRPDVRSADASSLAGAGASLAGGQSNLAGQVAGRILEALGTSVPSPGAPAPQPGETHVRMRAGGAALKTLTIQLQPEHLGTLEVSMRLNEGKLTLELSASQADTAVLLADDRGTLRAVLEHAGFSVDDAAITVVTRDSVASAARSSDIASGGGSDSRSPSSGGQSRGGDAGTGEGSRQSPERRPAPTPETQRRDAAQAPQRAGSTYL